MLDLFLREVKEIVLKYFIFIIPKWLTPNRITTIAFLFGIYCAYECAFGDSITFQLFLWLINRTLDGIDGVVARARNL